MKQRRDSVSESELSETSLEYTDAVQKFCQLGPIDHFTSLDWRAKPTVRLRCEIRLITYLPLFVCLNLRSPYNLPHGESKASYNAVENAYPEFGTAAERS